MVHNNSALWLVAAAGTLAPYWKKGRITEQVQNENRRKSWTIICPVHPGYRPHCMLCAQRRSAPERACTRGGGTKRVFFSTTLTETNYVYRAQRTEKRPGGTYRPITDNKSYTWRAQPCDNHLKEIFLSLLFLFVCLFLFAIRISRFLLLTYCFLAIRISFYPPAFFHPQVCARYAFYRHSLPDCMELLSLVKQRQQQRAQGWTRTRKNGTLRAVFIWVS